MPAISLEEARAHLLALIEQLQPGEEMTIVNDGQPLARITKLQKTSWPCQAGCYRKAQFWMASDFDAPLDDFQEYME